MKISIITTAYNSAKTIEETILSVLSQTYQNFEHIIIDGNSKDNTMKIVKKYEPQYNGKLKYISETDKGIYDAMNKGIKMASGDVIGLLNSDDIYAKDTVLEIIAKSFKENNCDGIYGNLYYMNETMSKVYRKWISGAGKVTRGWIPAHPTLYLKKAVYNTKGLYNLEYPVVSDYDYMVRLGIDKNIKLYYIKDFLILMRYGGASNNGLKGYLYNAKESYIILKNNHIKFPFIICCCRSIKTAFQIFLGKFTKKKLINKYKVKLGEIII